LYRLSRHPLYSSIATPVGRTAGSGDPRRTKSRRRGLETLAERRADGGVWRRSPNEGPNGGVGRRSPNQTNSQRKQPGSEGGQDQPCSMSDRAWPGGLKDRPTAGQTAAAIGMVQKRVTTQGGWGRRPEGDAPRSEASALGARWLLPARPQPPSYCHLRG